MTKQQEEKLEELAFECACVPFMSIPEKTEGEPTLFLQWQAVLNKKALPEGTAIAEEFATEPDQWVIEQVESSRLFYEQQMSLAWRIGYDCGIDAAVVTLQGKVK